MPRCLGSLQPPPGPAAPLLGGASQQGLGPWRGPLPCATWEAGCGVEGLGRAGGWRDQTWHEVKSAPAWGGLVLPAVPGFGCDRAGGSAVPGGGGARPPCWE